MPKLNQVIAIEKGTKTQVTREVTDAHQMMQREALVKGIARTYQPVDDEGEQYPSETTNVQMNVDGVIDEVMKSLSTLLNVTATKDFGNSNAKANIEVDGKVLLADVPVPYLLFLEKKMKDVETFIRKMPVLDPSEKWSFDNALDVWTTEPVQTTKTKKVPRNHVKAEATPEHPAQVEIYYEDIVVGYWKTIKYSGALPANRVAEMLERVRKLQLAITFARESANGLQVDDINAGSPLLGYVFHNSK